MGLLGSVTVVTGSNRTHHEPPRTGTRSLFPEGSYTVLYRLTIHLHWRVLIVVVAAVAAAAALAAQALAANHSPSAPHTTDAPQRRLGDWAGPAERAAAG